MKHHSIPQDFTRCTNPRGWTLIELIGVLAVSALMVAMVAPVMLGQLDRAARAREIHQLDQMASGLREEIRRTGYVPDATTWIDLLASALGARPEDIRTNAHGLPRILVFHPDCQIGPATNRVLPFVQTGVGSEQPLSPRLILISSLGEPLPGTLTNGDPLTTDDFEAVWQSTTGFLPPAWNWSGRPEDLLLERLDLREEFIPLSLTNPENDLPQFAVGTNQPLIQAPGRFQAWYLRGTALHLLDTTGAPQIVEVIQAPAAWRFELGKWRRAGAWSGLPGAPSGQDFAQVADLFLNGPINPYGPTNGPLRVLTAMTNFSAHYEVWAADGFPQPLLPDSDPIKAWEELQAATAGLLPKP